MPFRKSLIYNKNKLENIFFYENVLAHYDGHIDKYWLIKSNEDASDSLFYYSNWVGEDKIILKEKINLDKALLSSYVDGRKDFYTFDFYEG